MDLSQALRFQNVPRAQELAKLAMTAMPTVTQAQQTTTTITGGVMSGRGTGKFRYTCPMPGNWNSSFYVPGAGNSGSPDLAALMKVDFDTDARYVELYTLNYNTNLDIRVNGVLVQNVVLNASGSAQCIKLDFGAGSAGTIKRIEFAGFNFGFGGVFTEADASVWYPLHDRRPLMYFFGDSYTQGTGAAGPDQVAARACADALGFRCYQDGIGGTGWTSSAGSLPVTRVGKRLNLMTEKPKIIVTLLGYNDAGGNMDTLKTNFAAWVDAARAASPDAQIIVVGPWTPLGATDNLTTVETTLQGAAFEKGLFFVSAKDFVTAANKARYTGADNVHPNQAGHDYLGARLASALLANTVFN
jgi:lysophospholipase L1-like esterase